MCVAALIAHMAPAMTSKETDAANVDSNGAATELWRNTRVLGIILVYCAIGSQLSVVNKVVVTFIPLPNAILLAQFTATTVMLLAAHYTKSIEVEPVRVARSPTPKTRQFADCPE